MDFENTLSRQKVAQKLLASHGNRRGLEDLMRQNWNHIKWNGSAWSVLGWRKAKCLGFILFSFDCDGVLAAYGAVPNVYIIQIHIRAVPCRVSCGVCVSEHVRACLHTYVKCRKIINDSKVFYTLHDARTCDCSHGICHSWNNGTSTWANFHFNNFCSKTAEESETGEDSPPEYGLRSDVRKQAFQNGNKHT